MTSANPHRLVHSQAGFVRQMQMSKKPLWIFVEGSLDRAFVGMLLAALPNAPPAQICMATELVNMKGGGKSVLLCFRDYLASRGLLSSSLEGKATTVGFFLDRDVDDKIGLGRRCPHMIYTDGFCVENDIFEHGNMAAGLATAAQLDVNEVAERLGSTAEWISAAALHWVDWVVYCFFTLAHGVSGCPGYGVQSQVHEPDARSPVNAVTLKALTELAKRNGKFDNEVFERQWSAADTFVREMYRTGNAKAVFKGKWYCAFLVDDAKAIANGRYYVTKGLHDNVASATLGTLDFKAPWAKVYRDGISKLILRLETQRDDPHPNRNVAAGGLRPS